MNAHKPISDFEMVFATIGELAMSLLPDTWITEMVGSIKMIEPFIPQQVSGNVVSYGLSSYGYDVRVSSHYKIFTNVNSAIVDPKAFDKNSFVDFQGAICVIPPNSFALSRTVEYFRIPRDVMGLCIGKSTYARCGIVVNVTPLQPEWEGFLTLEISNTTPLPARIYSNEGIAQLIFLKADGLCAKSYRDLNGKYQGQLDITLPKT